MWKSYIFMNFFKSSSFSSCRHTTFLEMQILGVGIGDPGNINKNCPSNAQSRSAQSLPWAKKKTVALVVDSGKLQSVAQIPQKGLTPQTQSSCRSHWGDASKTAWTSSPQINRRGDIPQFWIPMLLTPCQIAEVFSRLLPEKHFQGGFEWFYTR